MSIETSPASEKEIFDTKMDIQRRLIERSHIGSNEDRTQHGLDWVATYAEKFSKIFDQKLDDQEFLERCKSDFENTVKQLETELWIIGVEDVTDNRRLAA